MQVVSFVPSVMLSLTFATCIDYHLFMLACFTDCINTGMPIFEAVEEALSTAGHTIYVSGGTLSACFLGLLFFSLEMLQSVGVGAAVAIFSVLAVTITLTPVLLLTIGPTLLLAHTRLCHLIDMRRSRKVAAMAMEMEMAPVPVAHEVEEHRTDATYFAPVDSYVNREFVVPSELESVSNGIATGQSNIDSAITVVNVAQVLGTASDKHSADMEEEDDLSLVRRGFWYKLGALLLTKWKGLLACLVLLALMLPVEMYSLSLEPDISFLAMIPKGCSSYEAYEGISEYFGDGFVTPYRIIFENVDDRVTIYSDEGFTRMQGAITTMINNLPYTTMGGYFGANILDGQFVSFADMDAAVNTPAHTATSVQRTYQVFHLFC